MKVLQKNEELKYHISELEDILKNIFDVKIIKNTTKKTIKNKKKIIKNGINYLYKIKKNKLKKLHYHITKIEYKTK